MNRLLTFRVVIDGMADFTEKDFTYLLNRKSMKEHEKKPEEKVAPAVKEQDAATIQTTELPNGETVKHPEVGVDRKREE
jgi:hypothetical protein